MSLESTYQMKKDDQNITRTIQKEEKRLFGFIRKRVNSEEDAQDILQEVFFQFIEMYRGLEKIERTTSWLYRVAKNKIVDGYRKKKEVSVEDHYNSQGQELYIEELIPLINNDTPEDDFTRKLVMSVLEEALDELPVGQKTVFIAHELEGLSFKEISQSTGITVNTLISRKRYAVTHLKEKLNELFNEIKTI